MLPRPHAMMEESDRKLYTLLSLKELGSCTHLQLLRFMVENEIMNYFDLSLALHDLVDEGQASKKLHPADYLYEITPAGEEALSFFVNRLKHSTVMLIREKALEWKPLFTREKDYSGTLTQNQRGEYVAHLTLMDGDETLLAIDIPAPDRSLADRMVKAWPDKAGMLYQQLLMTLGEEPEDP